MSAVLAEPGSAEWLFQKTGKLGASRFADSVRKLAKGGWASTRRKLQLELLAERLTGQKQDQYVSLEMLRGIEMEEAAAVAYEFDYDVTLEKCGFVEHPTIAMAGCTPDRLCGADELIEFKCPKTTTLCDVVLTWTPDADYVAQCFWQMACMPERKRCILAYYDDRMPIGRQLFVFPIERDDSLIAAMEAQAIEFLDEITQMEKTIRGI